MNLELTTKNSTGAGRPAGTDTGKSFNDIVKEISDVTQLKPVIVRSVLKCFSDIFIREVVLHGKFHWSNCFTVRTKVRPEHRGYNVRTQKYEMLPETKILQMAVSKKIRNFWKWKQIYQRNAERGVTKENWRSWYDDKQDKE